MTAQFLEYVRQELITATADMSGATKGQLVAFAENAQFSVVRLKRKRRTMFDEESGKLLTIHSDPVPGNQTRAKGSSVALICPEEFRTASWRRAVSALEERQSSWLLWVYAGDMAFSHQVAITKWAWGEFEASMADEKKMATKTRQRLRSLVWLAAQDVKSELNGGKVYQGKQLAELAGVKPNNWTQAFSTRWMALRDVFIRLDKDALYALSRKRSQQKADN